MSDANDNGAPSWAAQRWEDSYGESSQPAEVVPEGQPEAPPEAPPEEPA